MNSITLQIFAMVGVATYFVLILYYLKKQSLSLKYTFTWLALGVCMAILSIEPKLLNYMSYFLGVELPVNALFAMLFFFILLIIMTLTSIVSRQSNRIKTLVQSSALLEKRIRELERNLNE